MLMVMTWSSPPKSCSASASAVSVLPTPDGPTSRNTPLGRPGLSRPARAVSMRLAICSRAWSWPTTRPLSASFSRSTASISSVSIRPTGMPVQLSTMDATAWPSTAGSTSGASPCSAASSSCGRAEVPRGVRRRVAGAEPGAQRQHPLDERLLGLEARLPIRQAPGASRRAPPRAPPRARRATGRCALRARAPPARRRGRRCGAARPRCRAASRPGSWRPARRRCRARETALSGSCRPWM